jgi:lysophospholipase L1-like esterase
MSRHGLLPLLSLLLCAHAISAANRRIACVGNSITYGYDLWVEKESYPVQLDSLLPATDTVGNFGVSGKTMIRAVGDAYWGQTAFLNARAFLPSQVVIELGTNDSKDYIWTWYKQNFATDYRAMIDTFRILSSRPEVWVTLQPPVNNPSWKMYDTTIVRQVNPLILQAALEMGAPVIDLHTAMTGHPDWFQADSVHPNAAGAKALARIVAGSLARMLPPPTLAGATLTAPQGFGYAWYRNDSLLRGETSRTLQATIPGAYKVSVQVDSLSASRLLSPSVAVGPGTAVASRRMAGEVITGSDLVSQLRRAAPSWAGEVRVELRDTRGQILSNDRPVSGVVLYVLTGRNFRRQGRILVP